MNKDLEALECLERIGAEKLARGELIRNDDKVEPYLNTIKQALLKAQKEHKALEIIKEKCLNVYWFKSELTLRNISYRYYVNNFGGFHNGLVVKLLDEEEFNLLKGILNDEQ